MQTGHCQKGMVFAINPPTTGAKTFQNFKNNAMGSASTATVYMTATASTIVIQSIPASAAPPPPPPPPMSAIPPPPPPPPPPSSSSSEECQCICNLDFANGPVNPLQGINDFGGQVGNLQSTRPSIDQTNFQFLGVLMVHQLLPIHLRQLPLQHRHQHHLHQHTQTWQV